MILAQNNFSQCKDNNKQKISTKKIAKSQSDIEVGKGFILFVCQVDFTMFEIFVRVGNLKRGNYFKFETECSYAYHFEENICFE